MKKNLYICLLAMALISQVSATRIAVFENHIMPHTIEMDETRLYITEDFSVFIYSMKDFSLIKKFGKRGEGPGEFKSKPQVHAQGDFLLVNSPFKVSFYSKAGVLLREVTNIVSGRDFVPLGNRYVGYQSLVEKDGIRYSGIYLYDSGFQKMRAVYSYESIAQSQRGRGWMLFSKTYIQPLVCDDKIVVAGDTGFVIHFFDQRGEKLFAIRREYSRVRFTEEHRQKVLDLYRTRPSTAPDFDWWKKNIHFPEYFPAIRAVYTADKRLYVRTYREENGKSEFIVFDGQGKQLKRVFLSIAPSQAKNAYPFMQDFSPFAIQNGKLYQLILDEKSESWILEARDI